jgi:hypothetical protein
VTIAEPKRKVLTHVNMRDGLTNRLSLESRSNRKFVGAVGLIRGLGLKSVLLESDEDEQTWKPVPFRDPGQTMSLPSLTTALPSTVRVAFVRTPAK